MLSPIATVGQHEVSDWPYNAVWTWLKVQEVQEDTGRSLMVVCIYICIDSNVVKCMLTFSVTYWM